MAWKCSLELTRVYNIHVNTHTHMYVYIYIYVCIYIIYIAIISRLARFASYVALLNSHNLLWFCVIYPKRRGSIWINYSPGEIRQFEFAVRPHWFATHTETPLTDIDRAAIISRFAIHTFGCSDLRPSVCLSPSLTYLSENRRVPRTHGNVSVFFSPFPFFVSSSSPFLPVPHCAEILSWITINLSQ